MSHIWVLVEWVDESDMFSSYGVVQVDPLMYSESELNPGRVLLIGLRHEGTARHGRIITLSENKHHVKAHKKLLERKDSQVKNVLQMCMQTIKGMQSDQFLGGGLSSMSMSSTHSMVNPRGGPSKPPRVLMAADSDDTSSSDEDSMPTRSMKSYYNTHTLKPSLVRRKDARRRYSGIFISHDEKERPMMASTPLPSFRSETPKVTFDQSTQTENSDAILFEKKLRQLYCYFQALTASLKLYKAPGCSMIDRIILAPKYDTTDVNVIAETVDNMTLDEIIAELDPPVQIDMDEMISDLTVTEDEQDMNLTNEEDNPVPNEVRVRRMSAQTTNSVDQGNIGSDMVPIGNGIAVVPARLLNEIDWNSYTTATRQLLQAIFPRRTLATHSLTGRPSPAFMNKPPKKCLNPQIVEDIVTTVSQRCGVEKRLVRNSITIKCTDEAKLYRNRQQFRLTRSALNKLDDSAPPSTSSSDGSVATS
nr:unnamed protein product [Amyelois transitella]